MAKLVRQPRVEPPPRRLLEDGPRFVLTPLENNVLFLRAVQARCWIAVSHYYLMLGTHLPRDKGTPYHMELLSRALDFSAVAMVTLCCRKVFDHDARGMTGRVFASAKPTVVGEVARYWASNSGRSEEEARRVLDLLQALFDLLSRTKQQLKMADTALARRVGLLKRHADAAAAHISMGDYEFDMVDCTHVIAAMALVGAYIARFDDARGFHSPYDQVDRAALEAARHLYPDLWLRRLFDQVTVERAQALYLQAEAPEASQRIATSLLDDLQL